MAETLIDAIERQIPGLLEHVSDRLVSLMKSELSRAVTQAQQAASEAHREREAVEASSAQLRAEAASLRKVLGKPA